MMGKKYCNLPFRELLVGEKQQGYKGELAPEQSAESKGQHYLLLLGETGFIRRDTDGHRFIYRYAVEWV